MKSRFLILALPFLGAVACGGDATVPATVTDPAQLPADQVIYGLRHVMTKDGVRSAVLNGDTAYLQEEGRRFDLVGVELFFFTESGVQSGKLTSTSGEYSMSDGSFIARGNVVLITEGANGNRRLETEELHYDVSADQLWSDVPFVLTEGGRVTRGESFRSDAEFDSWSVTGAQTDGGLPQGTGGISF